jgi:glycosyltransferase involved in cell wall biosynthesis
VILSSGVIELFILTRLLRIPYMMHHHLPCSMSYNDYLKFSSVLRKHFEWLCSRTPYAAEFGPMQESLSLQQRASYEIRGRVAKAGYDNARLILVLSKYAKQEAERLFRAPVANLQGALDSDATDRYRNIVSFDGALISRPLVLTVARLVRHKRIDVAIRAFAQITQEFSTARHIIIGSGEDQGTLEALIAELRLEGRCRLLGYMKDDHLARWYKTCDLFVSVDWADYRLTAFEALAAGKQVILSDESEVNDDLMATGFVSLSKPEPAPLAHAIRCALARRAALDPGQLGPVLEHYTWEAYFRAISDRLP